MMTRFGRHLSLAAIIGAVWILAIGSGPSQAADRLPFWVARQAAWQGSRVMARYATYEAYALGDDGCRRLGPRSITCDAAISETRAAEALDCFQGYCYRYTDHQSWQCDRTLVVRLVTPTRARWRFTQARADCWQTSY